MMTTDPPLPGFPDPARFPGYYAGVPAKRAFAWVIDSLAILVLTVIAIPLTAFSGLFFLPVLYLTVGFLYRWVTLSGRSATPGMRFAGIEFRTITGERFDAALAGLHTLGYTVSVMVFPLQLISVAAMVMSRHGQGLSDHVLGTVAVNR